MSVPMVSMLFFTLYQSIDYIIGMDWLCVVVAISNNTLPVPVSPNRPTSRIFATPVLKVNNSSFHNFISLLCLLLMQIISNRLLT